MMEEFGKEYATLRKPRKLVFRFHSLWHIFGFEVLSPPPSYFAKVWKHNLGMVELELTVAKEKKSFTVSAVHANMILKFGEKGITPRKG